MDMTVPTIIKVTKCKTGPFEYTVTISKHPAGSVYLCNIIYYLVNLLDPFSRGLEVYLEKSSTFSSLIPTMHNDRIGLFYHF